ncbi:MAG: glycosyl transferase family 1 [Gallionellales bacterium RBG_16_56_9]|nr:MAG: glycosyl transferase family 1 [Gallionellales bacterium RBG_16_56_9]
MKVLHVVRRYGPVGGMERYVWELTRELRKLGHEVEVLCEVCLAEKPNGHDRNVAPDDETCHARFPLPNPLPQAGEGANGSLREFHVNDIAVHELGRIAWRPRWLSLLRFGWRAARWLKKHPHPDWLIHSHERINVHHVTTFHGPPFAGVFEKPFWRLLSIRVLMQLYLERRELTGPHCIVPNSQVISNQLAHYYPQLAGKLTVPVVPGVQPGKLRAQRTAPAGGGVIGFVGKEWQRKGLPLAAEIVARLRRIRPELELWVVGPQPEEIRHLFAGWRGGYRLLGWSGQSYYAEFDVLLHPAKAEPYGMVVSEAMAAKVPVVVSDVCGAAAQVAPDAGAVLPLSASLEAWASAVEEQLRRSTPVPQFERSWHEAAREYEKIYQACLMVKSDG